MIFLDVLMPKMDGWAVLTALKADPDTAGIPVIMMTLMNEAEMGYLLGASEYLHKPIDRDRLLSVIDKYRTRPAIARCWWWKTTPPRAKSSGVHSPRKAGASPRRATASTDWRKSASVFLR
ncbi:MAG: response regulator [Tepidisphaeraceae bacterium]